MAYHPTRFTPRMPAQIEDETQELLGPEVRRHGFISWSFSSTEITSTGGSTRVRSRSAKLEHGKLSSSTFEGELPANAYADMVAQAQQQFLRQAELVLKSFSLFLPFAPRRDRD
jgi:hypothetical protein